MLWPSLSRKPELINSVNPHLAPPLNLNYHVSRYLKDIQSFFVKDNDYLKYDSEPHHNQILFELFRRKSVLYNRVSFSRDKSLFCIIALKSLFCFWFFCFAHKIHSWDICPKRWYPLDKRFRCPIFSTPQNNFRDIGTLFASGFWLSKGKRFSISLYFLIYLDHLWIIWN